MSEIENGDQRLRLLVQRILRLAEERAQIGQDIRDVYAEAKAVGYDTVTLRKVVQRAGMPHADREEADTLLQTYEAALGGAEVRIDDVRPEARAMAIAMLAEQVQSIEDGERAAALVDHAVFILDIRAEIALLRKQEADRKALAKGEGFLVAPLTAAVRWIEKCAKHGRDAMRAKEATYQMYRGTLEAGGSAPAVQPTSDPALQKAFAPSRASSALAWHDAGDR